MTNDEHISQLGSVPEVQFLNRSVEKALHQTSNKSKYSAVLINYLNYYNQYSFFVLLFILTTTFNAFTRNNVREMATEMLFVAKGVVCE